MSEFKKTNQFIARFERARLEEIIFDDYIDFTGGEQEKVVGLFTADGPEETSNELCIAFFGKRAEIVRERPDGTFFDISVNVKTRWVRPKSGGDEFPVTDVVGYYVEESGSARNRDSRAAHDERRREKEVASRGQDNDTRRRSEGRTADEKKPLQGRQAAARRTATGADDRSETDATGRRSTRKETHYPQTAMDRKR